MGYNIADVSGNGVAGTTGSDTDNWTFTIDLASGATIVTGDFNSSSLFSSSGDSGGYTFSALSTNAYGTLSYNATTGKFTFTANPGAVYATGSDQTVTFTITGGSGSYTDTDTVKIRLLVCFARGTLIETPDGARPVEDITAGDLVRTAEGRARPVLWAGSRHVTPDEMLDDPDLRPVRITAGALAPGQPRRDLLVSAQHRILLGGWRAQLHYGEAEVLVPAKALIDGTRIFRDPPAPVDYHHLLLDSHDILLAEGAPAESFLAADFAVSALGVAARAEMERLLRLGLVELGAPARPLVKPREAVALARSA